MYFTRITLDRFEDERLLHVARKHFVYMFSRHIGHLFILVGACVAIFFAGWGVGFWVGVIASSVVFLAACAYIAMIYFGTYLIVTSHRVISSVRWGIFRFHMREIRVSDLKETTSDAKHILEAIFHYGDICIYGMDHEEVIRFRWLSNANKLHRYISKVVELYHEHHHVGRIGRFDKKYDERKMKKQTTSPRYIHKWYDAVRTRVDHILMEGTPRYF